MYLHLGMALMVAHWIWMTCLMDIQKNMEILLKTNLNNQYFLNLIKQMSFIFIFQSLKNIFVHFVMKENHTNVAVFLNICCPDTLTMFTICQI